MVEDKDKSKNELIRELADLRQKHAALSESRNAEYRNIERELKSSEQKYRTVFEHNPDYIYFNDVEGFFVDASPSTLEVAGLSLAEFRTKTFLDFFAGENLEELIRASEDLKEGRPVYGLRLRIRGAGDRILELEINAVPLLENDRVTTVMSMARDITARVEAERKLKQTFDEMETRVTQRTVELLKTNQELRTEIAERRRVETALRESEELYRTLIETNPEMVLVADLKGRILKTSRNTMKMLGLEKMEDLIGHQTNEFILPEDYENVLRHRDQLVREGSYHNLEVTYRRKDGTTFVGEVCVSLLRNAQGEPWGLIGVGRDVTERQRAEAALRESEELYRTLVEISPDMIGLLDLEGRILFMNRRLKEAHGVQKEGDLIGRKVTDLIFPADREKALANISRASQGDFSRSNEYSIRLPDGSLAIWETISALVRDAGGNPKVILSINRDVTEQRKAEQALKESEELYRTLVETSPDVITIMDLEGHLTYASPRIKETYGYQSEDEYLGLKVSDLIAPADREKVIGNFRKSVREGSLRGQEYTAFRKDGKPIIVESRSSVLRDAAGRVKGLVGVTRDVTERKRAETALRESEERYRTLVETSPEAIFVTDLEGEIKEVSQRALEIMGAREKQELIGKSAFHLSDSGEHPGMKEAMARILETQTIRNVERVVKRVDGATFFGEISASIVRDAQGMPKELLVTIHDVTERKRAEEALRESEELYRSLVDTSPDVIVMMDMEGRITYANSKIYDLHGFEKEEEFMGKKPMEFVAPEELERSRAGWLKMIRLGSLRNDQYRINRKDGKLVYAESNSTVIRDSQGRPKGTISIVRDVTERERAEKALRDSEELYRTLMKTYPEAVLVADLKGRIIDVSDNTMKLLGVEKAEDVIGKDHLIFAAPWDRGKIRKNRDVLFRDGFCRGTEYDFQRADGEIINVEISSSLLRDPNGEPRGWISVARDITERKRAEAALRESEAMYRTLIETSPDVITLLDLEGRIIYATDKIYGMYGYKKAEEFLGKKAQDFVPPQDRKRVAANLLRSARLGSLRGNEYVIPRKDGKVVVTEVSSALVRDGEGQPKSIIAVIRDVTERKRAEEALRESEELYRTLVDTSPDAIVSTDMEMRITEASQRALELFGADRKKDLIGKMSLELTDPKERREIKRYLDKILEGNVVRNVEKVFSRINGADFIGEASAALLKDGSGAPTGFLVTIRDITERKRMEKEILEIAALERRRIGHDLHDGLGQHLAAISFMNKVLEDKLAKKCPAEAREAAKISKLISEAISQSRDLSRGINPVEPRPDGLMSSLRQLSVNQERLFKVSCLFQCPRRVLVDDNIISTNLYYIAQEAVSNAIKHGQAGQVKIRLSVVRKKLTLSVSDDGVGLPKDFKFTEGLGLQIMDYRAKVIGASLGIQPGRDRGTTVTCSLRTPERTLH